MTDPAAKPPVDPKELLRSPDYLKLLVLAGLIGAPVSAIAYGYLKLVAVLQNWIFKDLPDGLGFSTPPDWWPIPVLAVTGLLVALAIRLLPGIGGHSPADGFKAAGALPPRELAGVIAASIATLAGGAVLGPEAPLIAIGSGLGVLAVRLATKDAPQTAAAVIAAAGSFAAISSLLGSPLLGAFLLLEASGLGGPMLIVVLMPGLLAAGIGAVIFLGLDSLTGYGTFSLTITGLPTFDHLTVAMFLWAAPLGIAAALLAFAIRRIALALRARVEPRMVLLMPVLGVAIGGLAVVFSQITDKPVSDVLFSGQDQLPGLLQHASTWSVGALVALIAFKGVAYGISLSSFRGGPVFPSMFIGAAGGLAAAQLPGLSMVPAVAMGIGAMCASMLTLPLTATLLATLLLGEDGVQSMPVVIVAVVVAFVVTARLPLPATDGDAAPAPPSPASDAAPKPVVIPSG